LKISGAMYYSTAQNEIVSKKSLLHQEDKL